MDPKAAWRELTDTLARGDHDTAKDRAEALLNWTRSNGYNPINCSHAGSLALLGFLVEKL
jgi:hypothetical protein